MKVTCPQCKEDYEVDDSYINQNVECQCGHEFTIITPKKESFFKKVLFTPIALPQSKEHYNQNEKSKLKRRKAFREDCQYRKNMFFQDQCFTKKENYEYYFEELNVIDVKFCIAPTHKQRMKIIDEFFIEFEGVGKGAIDLSRKVTPTELLIILNKLKYNDDLNIKCWNCQEEINFIDILIGNCPSCDRGIFRSKIRIKVDDFLETLDEKVQQKSEDEKLRASIMSKSSNGAFLDKNANKDSAKDVVKLIIFIGVLVLICWFFLKIFSKGENTSSLSKSKTVSKGYKEDLHGAWAYATLFVEQELKAPSTAKFEYAAASNGKVVMTSQNKYTVKSYVDSQNSFGAMLRQYFLVEIEYQPSIAKWLLLNLEFSDKPF